MTLHLEKKRTGCVRRRDGRKEKNRVHELREEGLPSLRKNAAIFAQEIRCRMWSAARRRKGRRRSLPGKGEIVQKCPGKGELQRKKEEGRRLLKKEKNKTLHLSQKRMCKKCRGKRKKGSWGRRGGGGGGGGGGVGGISGRKRKPSR